MCSGTWKALRGFSLAVLSVAAVAAAVAALPAAASASPSWSKPVTLGPTGRERGTPAIAIAPDGEEIATWLGVPNEVEVRTRRPGRAWSPPVTIASTRQEVEGPRIATSARKTVIVWSETIRTRLGEARVIMAATRLRGKKWSKPRNISAEKGRREEPRGEEPEVTMTPAGKAFVIWNGTDEDHLAIDYLKSVTQGAGGTSWTAPVGIRGSYEGEGPQIGATAGGEAVAIWGASYNEESGIRVSSRPPNGPWKAGGNLGFPGPFPAPELAITSKGEAVGAWVEEPENGSESAVRVATRPAGGKWKVKTLTLPGDYGSGPEIVTEPGGRATVVWIKIDSSEESAVVASTHSPGAGWSKQVDLTAEGLPMPVGWDSRFAVTGDGERIAVWASETSSEATAIRASSKPRGGSWSQTDKVSTTPRAPLGGEADLELKLARSGEALAVWRCFDGREWVIKAATRPPAG